MAQLRQFERFDLVQRATWDLFSERTGSKSGYITNISQGGCLLKTFESIEHRRWIRLVVNSDEMNLGFSLVGRVSRKENIIEVFGHSDTVLYRYGVEFMKPEQLRNQDLTLILAASSRNFTTRSCRIRNIKSSFLPGSLA